MFELLIIIGIFLYVRNRKKKDLLYYYQQKELEEKSKELNFVEYKKKQMEQNKVNNSGTVAFLITQTILIVAFMLLFKRNSY